MMCRTVRMSFISGLSVLVAIIACQQTPEIPEIPEDYRTWSRTTETVLDYAIPGHENHFRKIYINGRGENVQMTERNGRTFCKFPEGTIIVKEIYASTATPSVQESPVLLTVMIKHTNHPESRGGWLWLSQNYQTKESRIIDYEFCVDCHANANERHPYADGNPNQEFRDYVYFIPGQVHVSE